MSVVSVLAAFESFPANPEVQGALGDSQGEPSPVSCLGIRRMCPRSQEQKHEPHREFILI